MESLRVADVQAEALTWPAQARAAEVTDPDSYRVAAEMLLGIKALRNQIAAVFDSHISAAHKAHKDLLAEKSKAEAPLSEAERIIKRALADFDAEAERVRAAESRRLEAAARDRAEAELLEQAAAIEAEGHRLGDNSLLAEAAELLSSPISLPTPAVISERPRVAGVTFRDVWRFEVVDPAAVPRQYLIVNESAIRSVVTGLKGNTKIPGVRVYVERVVAAGR